MPSSQLTAAACLCWVVAWKHDNAAIFRAGLLMNEVNVQNGPKFSSPHFLFQASATARGVRIRSGASFVSPRARSIVLTFPRIAGTTARSYRHAKDFPPRGERRQTCPGRDAPHLSTETDRRGPGFFFASRLFGRESWRYSAALAPMCTTHQSTIIARLSAAG